jgi:hypothetical protein
MRFVFHLDLERADHSPRIHSAVAEGHAQIEQVATGLSPSSFSGTGGTSSDWNR